MQRYQDALHRDIILAAPPRRIVSLVPSETYNLFALGVGDRVVGRTTYCVEPSDVTSVPCVGGTKNVEVEAIIDLAPDLVLVNREENARPRIQKLIAAGLPVYVSFPRSVREGLAHFARLARMTGADPGIVRAYYKKLAACRPARTRSTAFVPVWNEPLMTFCEDTFADDVLGYLGLDNAFAAHRRETKHAYTATGHPVLDDRYPRLTKDQVIGAAPEVVILPDEPYAFSEKDLDEWLGWPLPAAQTKRIFLCSGKDLFWHGAWAIDALPALQKRISLG